MNICSLAFFACCCIAPILFHFLPYRLPRRLFLSALNLAFLWSFVPNNRTWAAFAAFIVGTYCLIWFIRRRPSGWVVFLGVVGAVVGFLLIKKYTFVPRILPIPELIWDHKIGMIGLSYMLFKFIHALVDTWQGQLERCSLFSYANYQLGFFTLLAGPIQRYNDFHQCWESMDAEPCDTRLVLLAWNRILTGFIKMGGLAVIARCFYDWAVGDMKTELAPGQLILRFFTLFYCYAIFLYFNFSGYTDIMIGCGRLFGFKLPENFDRPYLARNVIDFWNRWHITLTHWIRDYIFMTSYKAMAQSFPHIAKYAGYGFLFLSLFLAGVWHGSTVNFAIYGFLQGLGAMVVQIYGDILKYLLGREAFVRYQKNQWVRRAAIFATLNFFCFSLLFFELGLRTPVKMLTEVCIALISI